MKFQFININTYQKPIRVNAHVHRGYELVYYINGQGVSHYGQGSAQFEDGTFIAYTNVMSNESAFYFSNNSFILYPPGTVHDEQHIAPCRLIAIGFEENDFPFEPAARLFKDYNLSVLRAVEKIAEEYKTRSFMYHKVIEAMLTELLVSVYRMRNVQPQPEQFDPIGYTLTYIDEYFSTGIDIDNLAASTNYSVSRFRELFKEHTGVSPKAYILNKRIDYAKQLLAATDMSIGEVASLVGFTDYPQFNKFFNSRTGMNPKEYRAALAAKAGAAATTHKPEPPKTDAK